MFGVALMHLVETILDAEFRMSQLGGRTTDLHSKTLFWQKSSLLFQTLNCDASVSAMGAIAGCGSLLRDSQGKMLLAFAHKLQPCSVLEAEIRAILHGLSVASIQSRSKLVVESDNAEAIKLIVSGVTPTNPMAHLV